MSEHLTDRNFWESFWRSKKGLIFKIKENYVFGHQLADIVKKDNTKSAIELGGFPVCPNEDSPSLPSKRCLDGSLCLL